MLTDNDPGAAAAGAGAGVTQSEQEPQLADTAPTAAEPLPSASRAPSHLYYAKLWDVPVGRGASGTLYVELDGYAKVPSASSPLVVVNELVASRLATVAGLPVPPGCLLVSEAGAEAVWVTLSYLPNRRLLPDVDPGAVVAAMPEVAAGVVAFDFVIANTDRSASNLALVNGPVLTPSGVQSRERLEVFDHSHAVVYTGQPTVAQYLASKQDEFIIGTHCLIGHLTSADYLLAWAERLRRLLTDEVVHEVCAEAAMITGTFTDADATALSDFLRRRRDAARGALRAHAAEFRSVPADAWIAA